ncbi:hypothetical protein ABK040_006629 [Willaertia magna]
MNNNNSDFSSVYSEVMKHYSEKQAGESLISNSCFTASKPHSIIQNLLKVIPEEVHEKFFGCGSPVPLGIKDLTVLDLGSGSGRDVFLASLLSGPKGKVTGVDMTKEQVELARRNIELFNKTAEQCNLQPSPIEFQEGFIEDLKGVGIENESVDLVTSNCVINLSPQKEKVLREVYRVLKFGGEFIFSDIYCDRRLNDETRKKLSMLGSCIGTVYYVNDFLSTCKRIGFKVIKELHRVELKAGNEELQQTIVGKTSFFSITFRLFKLANAEESEENYGQFVSYKGTISGYPLIYKLDRNLTFETNLPVAVSGNVASLLEESWLAKHFNVIGKRGEHYGEFNTTNSAVGEQNDYKTQIVNIAAPSCCNK